MTTLAATRPSRTPEAQQQLRLRRFLMASSTYALGLAILTLCSFLGLLPWLQLAHLAAAFVIVNVAFYAVFRSGLNLRLQDPSLTMLQVCTGVTMVALILVRGRDVSFVAAPFYSSLFVFAMLQLQRRALSIVAAYLLLSYGAAVALRGWLYRDALDLRVEAITAIMVVCSSMWFAAAAGYISRLRLRLRQSLAQIEALATRDGLTGLWNRRHIDLQLESEIKRAERSGSPLCVAMVDVDHFKAINDRFGHPAGDEVLKLMAGCMAGAVRSGDQVGRFGGEEFLLVLPGTSMAQAQALAERLRTRLEALDTHEMLHAAGVTLSASFGLAAWRGGESASELVRRADQAMYRAKAGGRNRVEADSLFRGLG
jgi:diguanylate cyclase (GGDEF)-like protein